MFLKYISKLCHIETNMITVICSHYIHGSLSLSQSKNAIVSDREKFDNLI